MAAKRPRILTLSAKESLILELLTEHDELYGLQLVASSKRKLKRGTVYVTLGRMEEKGYITSRLAWQDPPRRSTSLAIVRRASALNLTSRPQLSPFFQPMPCM